MIKFAMVGLGGALGAICRYITYEICLILIKNAWLPIGTMTVNIGGCFIIGLLGGLAETRNLFSPDIRALIFIGFLGSFTTFSTFGFETVSLIRSGQTGVALANVLIQVIAGLAAVSAGLFITKLL